MERRLAAILFYDVVGYSKSMGRDEALTIDALKANRETLRSIVVAEAGAPVMTTRHVHCDAYINAMPYAPRFHTLH